MCGALICALLKAEVKKEWGPSNHGKGEDPSIDFFQLKEDEVRNILVMHSGSSSLFINGHPIFQQVFDLLLVCVLLCQEKLSTVAGFSPLPYCFYFFLFWLDLFRFTRTKDICILFLSSVHSQDKTGLLMNFEFCIEKVQRLFLQQSISLRSRIHESFNPLYAVYSQILECLSLIRLTPSLFLNRLSNFNSAKYMKSIVA